MSEINNMHVIKKLLQTLDVNELRIIEMYTGELRYHLQLNNFKKFKEEIK